MARSNLFTTWRGTACRGGSIAALSSLAIAPVQAEPVATLGAPGYLSMLLSLLVVVALILGLAWLARRFNLAKPAGGAMKVVAMLPLGGKERVVIVEVQGKQYMLGVTSSQVRLLETLSDPIKPSVKSPVNDLGALLGRGSKGAQ